MNPALLAVALAAVDAPAPAEEVKLPQGVPPVQVVAQVTEGGQIQVTEMIMVSRQEKRVRSVVENGKPVPVEYVVTMVIPQPRKRLLPKKGVTVSTAAGKEIAAKDLAEKLKGPTVAFLAWDGKKVDPFYLKPLKDDVLIIVAPPEPPPAPGGGDKPPPDPLPPTGKEPVRKPAP
jgi:hypothetical protein